MNSCIAPALARLRGGARRLALALALPVVLAGCASTATVAPPIAPGTVTTPSAVPSTDQAITGRSGPPVRLSSDVPLSDLTVAPMDALTVTTLAAPADLWERIRRGLAMNNLDDELVRQHEQWYLSRPDYIQRMTERSSRYLFHIVEEIEVRGMPMELALLPFIESAFNPQAVSSARAAGMWQFMPATGASFDLKQNAFRDDRRDVLASTRAALDYLEQLHARFGDWHLALAAYNWGQGNVSRAITRNQRAGLPTGYNDLNMPAETRHYVPKLQAVKNIVAHPARYAATLPDIGNHPFFDLVSVERDMDVALIARLAEVDESDFRALNPSLKQPLVMAAGTPNVLLPWDNAVIFQRNLQLHDGPLASWTAWVVPTTMTVAQAARQVGVSETELRKANAIPPRMRLRAGSSLIVPRNGKLDRDVPAHVADNGMLSLQPEVTTRRVVVKARKGETVARLANRYGLSAASVAEWNRLSAGSTLKTGQRVTLHLPQRAKATTSARSSKPVKPRATSSKTASTKKATIKKSSTAKAPPKKTARK